MKGYLKIAYASLNESLFESRLPSVDFVLDPGRKYIFNWRPTRVVQVGGGIVKLRLPQILDELVHVMVHLANKEDGVIDHTTNQYHKKAFCDRALNVGLVVCWHQTRGWGITSSDPTIRRHAKVRWPSPASIEALKAAYKKVDWPHTILTRSQQNLRRLIANRTTKQYMLKYVCQCLPPVIIRSGRRPDSPNPLDVYCNLCCAKFVIDEAGWPVESDLE